MNAPLARLGQKRSLLCGSGSLCPYTGLAKATPHTRKQEGHSGVTEVADALMLAARRVLAFGCIDALRLLLSAQSAAANAGPRSIGPRLTLPVRSALAFAADYAASHSDTPLRALFAFVHAWSEGHQLWALQDAAARALYRGLLHACTRGRHESALRILNAWQHATAQEPDDLFEYGQLELANSTRTRIHLLAARSANRRLLDAL